MPSHKRQVTYSTRPSHAARMAHRQGERQFKTYDTSHIRPRKSKGPMIFGIIVVIVVAILAVVFIGGALRSCSGGLGSNPNMVEQGTEVTVTISEGEYTNAIADKLYNAGLIPSTKKFTKTVSDMGADTALRPGTYVFVGGMTMEEIVTELMAGPKVLGDNVTIPEGYALKQIGTAVEAATNGAVKAADFEAAASDASVYAAEYAFLADAGTSSLEGFLFPKTYTIVEGSTAQDVVRMMLDQFKTEIAALDFSYPESNGFSIYEVVNLASIVEREGTTATMGDIASVFYNRLLNTGAPSYGLLQSDATTAYEVGREPTAEEVHDESSPYSTYAHAGLPPTPICNPGLQALQATCSPNQTDYYFFYFAPDGSYYFNETLEGHEAAIANS